MYIILYVLNRKNISLSHYTCYSISANMNTRLHRLYSKGSTFCVFLFGGTTLYCCIDTKTTMAKRRLTNWLFDILVIL